MSHTHRLKTTAASSWYTDIAKNWRSYVLLAPFMMIFLVFTVIPVFVTFAISLTNYNVLEMPQWVGLENYKKLLFYDDVFQQAVKNTLIFALVTGPIGYMLCFLATWAINSLNRLLKSVLTFVFYIPTISGTIYLIWSIIFSGDIYGYANSFLLRLGLVNEPIQWFTTDQYILPLIIIVQLWMSMGTGFLAMRAGMASIDSQYYEAGAIEGIRNRAQELWYITIPLMAPHLMTAAVLQVTAMFSNAAVAQQLAGFPSTNYKGHLIMTHMMDYSTIRIERGYASAIAVIMFVIILALNRLILKLLSKVGDV